MLRILFAVILLLPLPLYANENDTTTTTTTVPTSTTTTIPGETEEVETFDGPLEEETEEEEEETTTTTTTSTTTTIPTYEQSTDIELPEDELDLDGNEVENNIVINNHYDGQFGCTDFCMNLHYLQHGNDSEEYTFILPETTTVDEEELEIDIYEVGFTIGALNNESTVTYTHKDETIQENVVDAQSNSNLQTMLETVVYNIYDTLDTFIESFTLTINDWSLLDDISFKYVMPTTTTTTTTTLPPPPPEPPKPPPPPPEPEMFVVVLDDGTEAEYQEHEIEDGTVERDNERKANEDMYGCYMTDAQIERGDCDSMFKQEEETKEEVIIVIDEEEYDTEGEFFEDDDMVLDLESEDEIEELKPLEEEIILEEEIEIDVEELEEEFKFEETEFTFEDIPEEIIIEEIVEEDELHEEDIRRDDNEELEVLPPKDDAEEIEEVLTEEVVEEEVAELEEFIEEIVIEEVTTEKAIEVIEEVNDIGVQNLDQATEEVQEVVQAVVEEAIENVEELTEEQVEVVAEVLQVQTEDVEIIAEAVKEDEVIAEAVEEYVERAVENADVENYTLADVVTEVQYENFLENPIETFVDLDFEGITISNIGDDMTQDQKEKAQEVVVPVILTRIASMAAFVFRRSL